MSISLFYLGGIIDPFPLQSNCRANQPYTVVRLELVQQITELSIEKLNSHLKKSLDDDSVVLDSFFWKTRTIEFVAVSKHIKSICFLPKKDFFRTKETLFVEKNIEGGPFKGFFSPFFPDVFSEKSGCIDYDTFILNYAICGKVYVLDFEEQIELSLQCLLNDSLKNEIKQVVRCFLQDNKSVLIGLTYCETGKKFTTQFWCKSGFEAELKEACRLRNEFNFLTESSLEKV